MSPYNFFTDSSKKKNKTKQRNKQKKTPHLKLTKKKIKTEALKLSSRVWAKLCVYFHYEIIRLTEDGFFLYLPKLVKGDSFSLAWSENLSC